MKMMTSRLNQVLLAGAMVLESVVLLGCRKSEPEVIALFEKGDWVHGMQECEGIAVDTASPQLQYYVACAYKDGLGCEVDIDKSGHLFAKAADAGYADAMYAWGKMCICENKDEAIKFLEKASELGNIRAKMYLGIILATNAKGEEKEKGRKLIEEVFAQEVSDPELLFFKSAVKLDGICCAKNEELGWKLMKQAADGGFAVAQRHMFGKMLEVDFDTAADYLRKAAEGGEKDAAWEYAAYLMTNAIFGVPITKNKDGQLVFDRTAYASKLLLRSISEKKSKPEYVNTDNMVVALGFIRKAAGKQNVEALRFMGKAYWEGNPLYGIKCDRKAALGFWKKACALDAPDKEANKYLSSLVVALERYLENPTGKLSNPKEILNTITSRLGQPCDKKIKQDLQVGEDNGLYVEKYHGGVLEDYFGKTNWHVAPNDELTTYRAVFSNFSGENHAEKFVNYCTLCDEIGKALNCRPSISYEKDTVAHFQNAKVTVPKYTWEKGSICVVLSSYDPALEIGDVSLSIEKKGEYGRSDSAQKFCKVVNDIKALNKEIKNLIKESKILDKAKKASEDYENFLGYSGSYSSVPALVDLPRDLGQYITQLTEKCESLEERLKAYDAQEKITLVYEWDKKEWVVRLAKGKEYLAGMIELKQMVEEELRNTSSRYRAACRRRGIEPQKNEQSKKAPGYVDSILGIAFGTDVETIPGCDDLESSLKRGERYRCPEIGLSVYYVSKQEEKISWPIGSYRNKKYVIFDPMTLSVCGTMLRIKIPGDDSATHNMKASELERKLKGAMEKKLGIQMEYIPAGSKDWKDFRCIHWKDHTHWVSIDVTVDLSDNGYAEVLLSEIDTSFMSNNSSEELWPMRLTSALQSEEMQ